MLVNVGTGINMLVRQVVMNRPGALNILVYRRTINRTTATMAGGQPTLGGLGVIEPDDETDITWHFVGTGYALPADAYDPAPIHDLGDAQDGADGELRFLLEPEELPGEPGGFSIELDDVFFVLFGVADDGDTSNAAKLAFEITKIETVVMSQPFVPRYVCVRRDDLHILDPTEPADED